MTTVFDKNNLPDSIQLRIDELSDAGKTIITDDRVVYTLKTPHSQFPSITTDNHNHLTCMNGYVRGQLNNGEGEFFEIPFKKMYIVSHKSLRTHDYIIYNTETTVNCCVSMKGRLRIETFSG